MTFPEGILSLSNNYSIWQTLLAVNTHTDTPTTESTIQGG